MPDNNNSLAKALKAEAARLGFATCGITGAGHDFGTASGWLDDGCHGDMGWMEARADQRRGPQALWPEARSVIMLGMSYAPAHDPRALAEARSRGRISVYAQGQDYHDVVKKALKALARWLVERTGCALKVFVDTAPVMEKPLGQQAGLGWQGKHSNLVSRRSMAAGCSSARS
jgi:epoxyqueuosine reductase